MSPRRTGWDFAQLRTSFLSDDEFQKLSRSCRRDIDFFASVGLWAIALAGAWRNDDADVSGSLALSPDHAERLRKADLVDAEGQLTGFTKWTEAVRREREDDAERKRNARNVRRSPGESYGVRGSPTDADGVLPSPPESSRVVGVGVEVVVNESPPDSAHAPDEEGDPVFECRRWLARHSASIQDGDGFHRKLCQLVATDRGKSAPDVIAAFEVLWKRGGRTARQLVFGAEDVLFPTVAIGARPRNGAVPRMSKFGDYELTDDEAMA